MLNSHIEGVVTLQELAKDLETDDLKVLKRSAKKHKCLHTDGPFVYVHKERYLAAVEAAARKAFGPEDKSSTEE